MSVVDRDNEDAPAAADPRLFGRGMLYVVVWSLQLVAGIVVSPVLAHSLSPGEFGALASGIALHQVMAVLALVGIDRPIILQRSEDGNALAARGLVAVGIAISLLVTVVFAVTAPLWRDALGFGDHADLVFVVILWTWPAVAVQVMLSLLLAEDRFRPFVLVSAIAAVGGQAIGLVLLFTVHNDATTYAWGTVFSQTLAMAVGVVVTRPSARGLANWPVTRRAVTLGFPLAVAALAHFMLSAGDRIIIQMLLGTAEVGRYQVAYVVGSVVILLLMFTNSAWTPRFAAVRDDGERWALAARSRNELYRLLMPVTLGVTLGAPIVLRVIVPPSYQPESLTIVVFLVALSAFAVATSSAVTQLLLIQRRGNLIGIVTGVAALLNVLLNIALLPVMGIAGAAVATILAYALLAVLQLWALPRVPTPHRPPPLDRPPARLVVAVLAVVLASAATMLLPQTLEWNLARLAAGLGCLPWFLTALHRARRAGSAPTRPRTTDKRTRSAST